MSLKKTWSFIFAPIKFVYQLVVNIIAVIAILVAIGFIVVKTTIYSDKSKSEPEEYGVLKLNISNSSLLERGYQTDKEIAPFYKYVFNVSSTDTPTVYEIAEAIRKAKDDKRVTGLYLNLNGLTSKIASVYEIAQAIKDFKSSGKKVVTYSTYYSTISYYLASFADKAFSSEDGYVYFRYYLNGGVYYGDLYKNIGIENNTTRIGIYKSGPESEIFSHRPQVTKDTFADSFRDNLIIPISKEVAKNRGLSTDKFLLTDDQIVEGIKKYGSFSGLTKANGLLDGFYSNLELKDQLIKIFGEDPDKKGSYKSSSFSTYLNNNIKYGDSEKDHIAYLVLAGGVTGNGNKNTTINYSDTLSWFKDILSSKNIKGLVIRVDSPGGSSYVGRAVKEAIDAVAKYKKIPIVVSQSNYAASAGYMISSPADYVIAAPYTITGSIGTYWTKINSHNLFKKIGINGGNYHNLETGIFYGKYVNIPVIDVYTSYYPSGRLKEFSQNILNSGYNEFVDAVAQGRKSSYDKIHEVAQGRVWIANQAININLVDKLGVINDAFDKVKELIKEKDKDVDVSKLEIVYSNPAIGLGFKIDNIISVLSNHVRIIYFAYKHNLSFTSAKIIYDSLKDKNEQQKLQAKCEECLLDTYKENK